MFFNFSYFGYLAFTVMMLIIPFCLNRFGKLSAGKAAATCMIVPWMFGPNVCRIDLPLLPGFEKHGLAAIGAVLGGAIYYRSRLREAKPLRGVDLFIILLVIGRFGSYAVNREVVPQGPNMAPGLSLQDAAYYSIESLVSCWLPLLVGRAFVRSRTEGIRMLQLFALATLVQIPLVLFELRMGPNLHDRIYGYDVFRAFGQSIRDGGYRPKLFVGHGLTVGMVMMTGTLSAFALKKLGQRSLAKLPMTVVVWLLLAICVVVKAKSPLTYTMLGIGLVMVMSPKLQVRAAAVFASLVFFYAYIHVTQQFPRDEIMARLQVFGADRVQSMGFRFDNELVLVERAVEKMAFGWGGYGRERIFAPDGKDLTIQDGQWIIVLGQQGVVGLIAFFGTLFGPIFVAAMRMSKIRNIKDQRIIAVTALITGFYSFNMIPNNFVPNLPFFFAGAVLGLSNEALRAQTRERRARRASMAPQVAPQQLDAARSPA